MTSSRPSARHRGRRGEIIGKDAWQRRHVTDVAAHRSREVADRLWALGDAVEVAHASEAYNTGARCDCDGGSKIRLTRPLPLRGHIIRWRPAKGGTFIPSGMLRSSTAPKERRDEIMVQFTSPLLAAGEILLGFSVVMFVGTLIASFGDQLKVGRR